jgi:hypothetical protein
VLPVRGSGTLTMTALAEKFGSQQGHEPMVPPSPTLAASLRHSTELPKHPQLNDRAGIVFVDWDLNDPENPMNWGIGYRRFLGALVSTFRNNKTDNHAQGIYSSDRHVCVLCGVLF